MNLKYLCNSVYCMSGSFWSTESWHIKMQYGYIYVSYITMFNVIVIDICSVNW